MTIAIRSDTIIQKDVLAELEWDPSVKVTDVGVEVDGGVITLSGTVEHFSAKQAAELAAFRIEGVRAVANDIRVKPAWLGDPTDTEVARGIADVFGWTDVIPAERIHVLVANGWVTLTGDVDWHYEREMAETAAAQIRGVKGVVNTIVVRGEEASAGDVRNDIQQALVRHAQVDAEQIAVIVEGGHVTLTGVVGSHAERVEAERAAWRSPGVTRVTNNIAIRPYYW
jgi:osmotically-inducible protein OsmY